jgi:hypothetical protein
MLYGQEHHTKGTIILNLENGKTGMDVVEKPHPADDRRSKSSLHVFMFS